MTFALQAGDHVVTSPSGLLKADDRTVFSDALSLLEEARAVRDKAAADAELARVRGYAEGRETGLATVEDHLATSIADLARGIDEELAARRADIAAAALAAARAIIGTFDEAEGTARIAARAVDRVAAGESIVIAVAPRTASAVGEAMKDRPHVTIREDPDAGPLDCVVHTANGRIIASLSLQLEALAARWGVTDAGA